MRRSPSVRKLEAEDHHESNNNNSLDAGGSNHPRPMVGSQSKRTSSTSTTKDANERRARSSSHRGRWTRRGATEVEESRMTTPGSPKDDGEMVEPFQDAGSEDKKKKDASATTWKMEIAGLGLEEDIMVIPLDGRDDKEKADQEIL
jgi:hypothetical protein